MDATSLGAVLDLQARHGEDVEKLAATCPIWSSCKCAEVDADTKSMGALVNALAKANEVHKVRTRDQRSQSTAQHV